MMMMIDDGDDGDDYGLPANHDDGVVESLNFDREGEFDDKV